MATTLGWNNLARLTSILTQKSGSAALLNLGYSYYANSQIQQVTNNLDGLKTEKYTYDELRRLLTRPDFPRAAAGSFVIPILPIRPTAISTRPIPLPSSPRKSWGIPIRRCR